MIELGLRAHQEPGDWSAAAARPPETAAGAEQTGEVLDPGKYVASKQKDYILGECVRKPQSDIWVCVD